MKSHRFGTQKSGALIAQRTGDLHRRQVKCCRLVRTGDFRNPQILAKSTTERMRMPLPRAAASLQLRGAERLALLALAQSGWGRGSNQYSGTGCEHPTDGEMRRVLNTNKPASEPLPVPGSSSPGGKRFQQVTAVPQRQHCIRAIQGSDQLLCLILILFFTLLLIPFFLLIFILLQIPMAILILNLNNADS